MTWFKLQNDDKFEYDDYEYRRYSHSVKSYNYEGDKPMKVCLKYVENLIENTKRIKNEVSRKEILITISYIIGISSFM
jgi:hypothetical protein